MFTALPVLVSRLPVKDSMKLMNSLFPYKAAWNLNIIETCKIFEEQLGKLPPEEQISTCLNGYCQSKEYLYIQKLHKLLVPQRLNFIIKLDPPQDEI